MRRHCIYPYPSYDGPQIVPIQKVMDILAMQWCIKKLFSQHSLNSISLIHRLVKTRDIVNLSKKGIHHIMNPVHHLMYLYPSYDVPYPSYNVPPSIIWCTPIHHKYVAPHPSYDGGVEMHIYKTRRHIWLTFSFNLGCEHAHW